MDGRHVETYIAESVEYIRKRTDLKPKIIVGLSGGLSKFVEELKDVVEISACDVPHFPKPTAEGHKGCYIFGKLDGIPVVAVKGRCHYYEGYSPLEITYPFYVMNKLGAKFLLNVNATGSVNKLFKAGDIMMIKDHINFMGMNPLRGVANFRKENQFTNMTNAYDVDLRKKIKALVKSIGIDIREGVYIASHGPSYESKAEVTMFRSWGADAVGMSVVPEVLVANYLGMKVVAFCCIANAGADLHGGTMSHTEVLNAMKAMEPKLEKLLINVAKMLGEL